MIATLSSFATQFKPALIAAGKTLFEEGKVGPLVNKELVWQAEVTDTKTYKEVTVRVENEKVTDIFCPCGPAVCRHVIALMFALQQQFQIETEPFDPAMLEPPPHTLLGRRLNDLIYSSRAAGTKDGELEAMGASVNLKEPDVAKLRAMVQKGWFYPHEKSRYPILNGAKKLLGAAILKYEQKDYVFVFAIARAVLTEICSGEINGNSADECARAAVELLNTLCTAPEVPAEMRKEVFDRVVFACNKPLYQFYHKELLAILTNPLLDKDLQEQAAGQLKNVTAGGRKPSSSILDSQYELLGQMGRVQEQQQLMRDNPSHYRQQLIEEAYARKDYTAVRKLALDGVVSDWKAEQWKWKGWLLKVAIAEEDIEFIRSYHKELYFSGGWPEASYEAWRSTYTMEEWARELSDWLPSFEATKHPSTDKLFALAKVYVRENLAEKLLALVQEHCSFALARLAEPVLLPAHNKELMAAYRDWFIWFAGRSALRQNAIDLREMMKEVRRSSSPGRKMVNELIPHLFELHPTWKVFQEEVGKML